MPPSRSVPRPRPWCAACTAPSKSYREAQQEGAAGDLLSTVTAIHAPGKSGGHRSSRT